MFVGESPATLKLQYFPDTIRDGRRKEPPLPPKGAPAGLETVVQTRMSDEDIDSQISRIGVGEVVLCGNGLLVSCSQPGRYVYRAPRRGDVHLARRIRAAMAAEPGEAELLPEDIESVREAP